MSARVGILGAGALGCLFAHAIASHTDHEVWLFARSAMPDRIEVEGRGAVTVRVVTERPAEPVDLLLVLVKAYATTDALRWAAGALGPGTVALTLQNGLGNAEALAEAVGAGRVLAGSTAQGATRLGPGRVRHGGAGATRIGPWAGGGLAEQQAPAIADMLTVCGLTTEVVNDPRPVLWQKLTVSAGINAVTAILRVPNGEVVRRSRARTLAVAAAREAGAVAAALGVPLPGDPGEQVLAVAAATAANRSSMLQDVLAGRPTEVDAINGAVVALGRQVGVATPMNAMLQQLVQAAVPSSQRI